MKPANYDIAINDNLVEVYLSGTFTLSDIKNYEKDLKAALYGATSSKWAMIADIRDLEVSTMEAVAYTKQITEWILSNGCRCLVNVKEERNIVVDHQISIAAGGFPIYEVSSFKQGRLIAEKVLKDVN